jgi:bis(5'-nucleosyl)-tetraphosphatase (symmetrical)
VATYVIGDVQGCFRTLERLVRRIRFDPESDRVVLVGDLVNRGPRSAEVLRWAMQYGDRVQVVLGNHDLHLIGRHLGVAPARRRDTLSDVLEAPDRAELVAWLRRQPFAHRTDGFLIVHAGLLPAWTIAAAEAFAAEAAEELRRDTEALLRRLAEEPVRAWKEDLTRDDRVVVAIQTLTRLRMCTADGFPVASFHGPPAEAPSGTRTWFDFPERRADDATVVFGHWSALGLKIGERAICLDTGCVWGRELTALRLEDRALFKEPARD